MARRVATQVAETMEAAQVATEAALVATEAALVVVVAVHVVGDWVVVAS